MEQFEVHPIVPITIGNVDVSFTNASLWMVIVTLTAALCLIIGSARAAVVPGRMQSIAELAYIFVADMIRSAAGTARMQFFPFIFTLFVFVLFANFIGLIPPVLFHPFTITSHIVVTFALAFFIFLMVIVVGVRKLCRADTMSIDLTRRSALRKPVSSAEALRGAGVVT